MLESRLKHISTWTNSRRTDMRSPCSCLSRRRWMLLTTCGREGRREGWRGEGGSSLSLSLLDCTIKEDPELAAVVKTMPGNGTHACHNMQDGRMSALSSVVAEAVVVEEVGRGGGIRSHFKSGEKPRPHRMGEYIKSFQI